MKYKLRTSFLTIAITCFFLTSSCDTKENIITSKDNESINRLSDTDILTVSKAIKEKDREVQLKKIDLTSKNSIQALPQEPYLEYESLLAEKELKIQIDSRTSQILDQTYEENMQYLKDLHLFSLNELEAVTVFKDELIKTKNFKTSILHFENAILLLPMTKKKLQRFYNFIDGLKAMNNYDPDFFKGNINSKSTGRVFGTCLSASIGVGIAFAGLATIEVGSFGAATGIAVAGFIWASAEWGAACKGGYKKVYPAHIDKRSVKTPQNFLTLDKNGDLITSPIMISYVVKK
jgi:hypothetical protein